MNPNKILIFTAINIEAKAIRTQLSGAAGHIIDGGPVGIRATRLNSLKFGAEISAVLLCGLAGALNPQLRIGDLVLDDPTHLIPDTGRKIAPDPIYFLSPDLRLLRGRIHTAEQIVATAAEKRALREFSGADAVEMEQAIVREWCNRRGLPLIGLRAISDTADESLDPAILGFVDDLGRPRPTKIARGLLRRPDLIPQLLRLNASTKLALKNLGVGVRSIVDVLRTR